MPTGPRRRLQWPRGLSKHVPPSRRRAHIHIAEPQLVVEALPFLCALCPQERCNNCCVVPHTNGTIGVFLVLIRALATGRFLQEISLRLLPPVASCEDKIIGEDPFHGCNVIFLHRFLILGVKRANCVFIVGTRPCWPNPAKHCGGRYCQREKSRKKLHLGLTLFHAIPLSRPEMCSRFAIALHWKAVTNRCRSRLLGCAMCGNIAGALPQQNGGVCAPRTPGL
jgi:hypothetical protein